MRSDHAEKQKIQRPRLYLVRGNSKLTHEREERRVSQINCHFCLNIWPFAVCANRE